jgi:hypothetical protein
VQNLLTKNFPELGYANLGVILDKNKCFELRSLIDKKRPVESKIFYKSKNDFIQNGRWEKYAPGVGYNFTENMDLSFIESNPSFVEQVSKVLGKNYSILKRSVIRSVSGHYLPKWLKEYLKDVGRPNLNPFIRDKYQDVQYFYCTDYHQDKTRSKSNFVTFYVYLDEVDRDYSALRILTGSHLAGTTSYPHNLRRSQEEKRTWFYTDSKGDSLKCQEVDIIGKAGLVSCFHGLTLHGTPLNNSKNPRISIRYLLSPEKNNKENTLFNQANKLVYGAQNIDIHRHDINKDGSYSAIGSSLGSYE